MRRRKIKGPWGEPLTEAEALRLFYHGCRVAEIGAILGQDAPVYDGLALGLFLWSQLSLFPL